MAKKAPASLVDAMEEARLVADRLRSVDAARLIELIVLVNPTDRGLSPGKERARYRLKSKLQSRLVEEHLAYLDVLSEPDRPGVVLLVHRVLGRDAAHAILEDLDSEARRLLEARDPQSAERELTSARVGNPPATPVSRPREFPLTAGNPPATPVSRPRDLHIPQVAPDEPPSEVSRGRAALEAYDYDEAIDAFQLGAARGEDGALEGLLETLATLGRDAEVLELVEAIPGEVGADIALRAAESAVFLGELDRAERLLGAHGGATAGAVWRGLATAGLRAGDVDRADRAVRRARERDPAHSDQLALEQRLADVRERRTEPDRRLVEAGLARDDHEGTRDALQRYTSRHGDDGYTLWVREELARRQQRGKATDLADAAFAAEAAGELGQAARLMKLAAENGFEGAADLARALRTRARAQDEERSAQAALARLQTSPLEGLRAIAALDRRVREQVAATSELARWFSWLLDAGHGRTAAEAAIALAEARRLACGPAELAERLGPHRASLRALPEAQTELDAVAAWEAQRDEARRGALLVLVRDHLSAGRVDEAHLAFRAAAAFAPVDVELQAILTQATAARALDRRFEALSSRSIPLEARALARVEAAAAAARGEPEAARMWAGRAERLSLAVREVFDVRRIGPEGIEAHTLPVLPFEAPPARWLTPDGRSMWLVMVWIDRLLIIEIDVATGRTVGGWSLHLPERMLLLRHELVGDNLWNAASGKRLLGFDVRTGEVVAWTDLGNAVSGEVKAVFVHLGMAWVRTAEGANDQGTVVVDAITGARVRHLPVVFPHVIPGDPTRVVALRERPSGVEVTAYEADTQEVIGRVLHVDAFAPHAGPDGAVLLPCAPRYTGTRRNHKREMSGITTWLLRPGCPQVEIDAHPPWRAQVVCLCYGRRHDLVFVVLDDRRDEEVVLRAYRLDGSDAHLLWGVETPMGRLLTDATAEHVCWVVAASGGGYDLHQLGPEPPVFSHRTPWVDDRQKTPRIELLRCAVAYDTDRRARVDAEPLRLPEDVELDDPQWVVVWALRSHEADRKDLAEAWILGALRRCGPVPALLVTEALILRRRRSRAELIRRLEDADVAGALASPIYRVRPERTMLHDYYHLLGGARAFLGDHDGARTEWLKAATFAGGCDVRHELAVLEVIAHPERPVTGPLRKVATLARAAREASAHLAEGNAVAALSTLMAQAVTSTLELQTRALAARAALASGEAAPVAAAVRAIGAFYAVILAPRALPELPVAGALDLPELTELAAECRAWLDARGGVRDYGGRPIPLVETHLTWEGPPAPPTGERAAGGDA